MKKIKLYKVLDVYYRKGYDDELKLWIEVELKDIETEESHWIIGYESGYTGEFKITDYDCAPDFLNTFEDIDELTEGKTIKFIERI